MEKPESNNSQQSFCVRKATMFLTWDEDRPDLWGREIYFVGPTDTSGKNKPALDCTFFSMSPVVLDVHGYNSTT